MNIALIPVQELEQIIRKQVQEAFSVIQLHPIEQQDELLTIEQAAAMLSLAVPTLYSLVHRKEIPYCKPTGRRLYFSKQELLAWIKDRRVKTNAEIHITANQYLQDNLKNRKA